MTGFAAVSIVTGAGRMRGIGQATARLLSRDGCTVVVTERPGSAPTDAERAAGWRGAATLAEEIVEGGGNAQACTCDVTSSDDLEALISLAARLGPLSVLVNNAGTAGQASSYAVHDLPRTVWDDTVAVNLTSVYLATAAAVPAMIDSVAPTKAIVNLSSLAGPRPLPYYGGYSATKAGVEALTRQSALELARYGIRVNCVSPGSTDTDMIDATIQRAEERADLPAGSVRGLTTKRIPTRRFATPVEIAEAICFLAGERAAYITGQVLQVDGGLSLV